MFAKTVLAKLVDVAPDRDENTLKDIFDYLSSSEKRFFIAKHKLKAASSVSSSLKTLIERELVYETDNGYIIYDRFMGECQIVVIPEVATKFEQGIKNNF